MHQNSQKLRLKIFNDLDSVLPLIKEWQNAGEKIVFTNGCFDLMHLGHIDYLSKASDLGTKLVVGLNSDASTQQLKGPTRPITNEKSRAGVLAGLFFVFSFPLIFLLKGKKMDAVAAKAVADAAH